MENVKQGSGDNVIARAHLADGIASAILSIMAGSSVLLLILFLLAVAVNGIKALSPEILSFTSSGVGNELFNTIYLVMLSLAISVPIGIGAGIYMAEYASAGKVMTALRTAIETLSSLPSIVVGLFGYLTFIIMAGMKWNLFAGAMAVSILSLPLITSVTYDALKVLPAGYKSGSLAIGATHWETIWHVLLPAAAPPVMTGIVLAAGRGFGEAAALLYTAGMSTDINWTVWDITSPACPLNPFRPGETLALQVWGARTEGLGASAGEIAAVASMILVLTVLVFGLGARLLSSYLVRKNGGETS